MGPRTKITVASSFLMCMWGILAVWACEGKNICCLVGVSGRWFRMGSVDRPLTSSVALVTLPFQTSVFLKIIPHRIMRVIK